MTRHAKNCTAHTVYTYHERKKDALRSGYGTQEVRLGKDSIKPIDCCCLSLQPAKDPVLTPDGYLYDKGVILEYIIERKADIDRRLKLQAKQLAREANERRMQEKASQEEEARKFLSLNTLESHAQASAQQAQTDALASLTTQSNRLLPDSVKAASFWTPSSASVDSKNPLSSADSTTITSSNEVSNVAKIDTIVRCPMSRKPIKFKELTPVKFTKDGSQYCCAVSKDTLTNATHCVVLRTSGSVVTKEVVDTIIKRDMVDPINGKKLKHSDLIEMQRGSLGFADERTTLVAKRSRPCMQT